MRVVHLKQNNREENQRVRSVLRRLQGKHVVLVGLMGAGKTVIGRRLANTLSLPFLDADQEIEMAAGMSVPEIFEIHGEGHFRDGERKVIARLLDNNQIVLATGGGAFINEETRERIKSSSISIWLQADLDVLMERVSRNQNRPLLQTDNPKAVMEKLIEERYPIYAEADIHVMSRDVPHHVMMEELLNAMEDFLEQ